MPTFNCVGPRSLRSWAMTPLALTLGPRADAFRGVRAVPSPCEAPRVGGGQLPPKHVYVGQGHPSTRIKRTKWSPPFTPGHDCRPDEFLPRYLHFVSERLFDRFSCMTPALSCLVQQMFWRDSSSRCLLLCLLPIRTSALRCLEEEVPPLSRGDPQGHRVGCCTFGRRRAPSHWLPEPGGLSSGSSEAFPGLLGCRISSSRWWKMSSTLHHSTFSDGGSSPGLDGVLCPYLSACIRPLGSAYCRGGQQAGAVSQRAALLAARLWPDPG